MKRLSTVSATSKYQHHHHHHHHHHNSISYTKNSYSSNEQLFPLHRSVTDENAYDNNNNSSSSPITKFVCKLLGLAGPSASRPRLWHKSQSTTSITKSSVISSYKPNFNDNATIPADDNAVKTSTASSSNNKRSTTIKFATPNTPCTLSSSVMDWDRESLPNSNLYLNGLEEEDDSCSIVSSTSSNSITCSSNNSIASSIVIVKNSAAMDALVSASLLPSHKKKVIADSDFDNMPNIILENRKDDSEIVLTEKIAEMLRPYVPRRYRISNRWSLLYSIDQHGVSLATLYSLMKDYTGPCIMIIKDAKEQIFGAYLSKPLSSQSHYYGTGECFLWKLSSCSKKDSATSSIICTTSTTSIPKIKAYPWTGKNDYMILSDSNFIAIGGGNGKFGLWLNSELEKGYSNTCPTFDNESLSVKPEFECMELEIWGICI